MATLRVRAAPVRESTVIDMRRLGMAAMFLVLLAAGPARAAPEVGWWWNPSESGRGFFVESQNGIMYLAGYFYEPDGRATWLVSGGPNADPYSYQGRSPTTLCNVPASWRSKLRRNTSRSSGMGRSLIPDAEVVVPLMSVFLCTSRYHTEQSNEGSLV